MTLKGISQTKWSKEEDDRLRHARDNGLTIETIARLMTRTEHAVNARIRRLQIPYVRRPRNVSLKCGVFGSGSQPAPTKFNRPPEIHIAYGVAKPLVDLGADECKFPVEGMNLFCAAPCKDVYCETHRKVCYV